MGRLAPPLCIFLSYSHHDEKLCERFLVYLRQLERQGFIQPWHDRCITAGTEWAGAIDDSLNGADIIIFLVSADFLASDYCNDVEMTLALKRSRTGGARLLPVILKPCDWKTSPLAGFQVLPKDGKPIVDWKTSDHGFDNAVKGLRRLIVELCGTAPVGAQVVRMTVRRHPWRWTCVAALAVLLIVLSILWSAGQRHLKEGMDLLNSGRYADARPALERARSLMPFSSTAHCAMRAVELDSKHADERQLDEAVQESPKCAYIKLLRGDRKYFREDLAGALADYEEARQLEPRFAEAHFNIGRILDRRTNRIPPCRNTSWQ
jgi:hypothetical protein